MYIKRGQSLVEVLLAIGLTAILLPALMTGLIASREGKTQLNQRVQATLLLKQSEDAMRTIRNRDWSNISTNGTMHTLIFNNYWATAPGSFTDSNGFTQTISVGDVNRDSGGVIVPTPTGTLDPSTKRLDLTVSWSQPYNSSLTSSLYLTRWKDNLSYTETTQTQFNTGSKTGVVVRASVPNPIPTPDDGDIILASGGYGDWCNPSLDSNTLDLPGSAAESIIMATAGKAYIGTGGNASGDPLDYVTISNPTPPTPPVATLVGSFTANQYKSYGIFGDGTYAYLTTNHPGSTFEIIRLSDFSLVGIGNASSNGLSIFVTNNTAFVTSGDGYLNAFDITNPAAPVLKNRTALTGIGNKVIVVGNNAYVAASSSTNQLQIIPWTYTGGTFNFGTVVNITVNGSTGVDLTVSSDQTRTYLITALSSTQPEFFIIDTDPTSPTYKQTKGTYDTQSYGGLDPKAVAIVPGNIAIIGGTGSPTGNQSYQVLRINNDIPSNCESLTPGNPPFDIRALAAVSDSNNNVFTYLLAATNPEFRIILGGPGGGYSTLGTFESQTFNALRQTADNKFVANFNQPPNTSIQFQVALANLISGSCPSTFTYVGPTPGNPSSWFTPPQGTSTFTAPFPLGNYGANYSNPGQCFRYKVQLTSSGGIATPDLYDFTINYSP